VQVLVLGPLTVTVGAGAVPLGTPKQKATLALLVARANSVVPVDDVIAELWGERPPASALANARMYAANLRRALAAGAVPDAPKLTKRGTGYLLSIDPTQIDAGAFRELLRRARTSLGHGDRAGAADRFDRALGLWRGPALTDVPVGHALAGWCAAVHEERVRAVEDRADTQLAMGIVDRPTTDLRELLAAEPLRERAYALLIRARYLAGDVEGALATYDAARRQLIEHLGVEPGEELRRLQHLVLNRDESLAAPEQPATVGVIGQPATVPRQLPADVAEFVGRTEQLAALDALQSGAVVAITGTAGVGKTALAIHWAHRVADRFPDGQLYVNLRGFHPDGTVLGPAEAVRGFLDGLGVPPDRVPSGLPAQTALYRSLLAGRRVLIILDNAWDADQVRALLPGTTGCMVVVTSRNSLTGLVAVEGARVVTLALPSTGEAVRLLARRVGERRVAAEPDAAAQIVAVCARLPIALVIAAAHAATHPDFPLAAMADELRDSRGRLEALDGGDSISDVRALFSWSYQALSPSAARLFRLLGLHPGGDVSRGAAASLAGVPVHEVRPLLAELTRQHLIAERAPGRYGFHDLLGAYAIDQALAVDSPAQRADAVRRVLDYYLHSAWLAARALNPHREQPVPPAPLPGVVPDELGDRDTTIAWFTAEHPVVLAAVRLAATERLDEHAWHLARTLTTYLLRRGLLHDLIAAQEHAVAAAERLGEPTMLAHAYNDLAIGFARLGRFAEAQAHFTCSLDSYVAIGDLIGQAKAHGNLAEVLAEQGRYAEALEHGERSADRYVAAGQPERQGHALNMVGWCYARLGQYPQALAYCERALARFREEGDRYGEAHAWDSLGHTHHKSGRYRRAMWCYRKAVTLFRDCGDRFYEADSLAKLGDAHLAAGERNGARTAWEAAAEILDDLAHPMLEEVRARLS
jgi:DNA-binding SARP family transcriptional activator